MRARGGLLLLAATGATLIGADARSATGKAMVLLEPSSEQFWEKTGCVACHHHGLVSLAAAAMRTNGLPANEKARAKRMETVAKFLEVRRPRLLEGVGIPGETDTMVYVLFGLLMDRFPGDEATDAGVRYLLDRQGADGSWRIGIMRPPLEHSSIANTALALRVVSGYAPPAWRAETEARTRQAVEWLEKTPGKDTEDLAFRLLGLVWGKGSKEEIGKSRRALLTLQRKDGGWGQDAGRASDAYATGQAVTALLAAGEKRDAPAVRRAVAFLLQTQKADGSWYVKSHVEKFQPYFESGFPYGHDQWISAAATAWAVAALAGQIVQ